MESLLLPPHKPTGRPPTIVTPLNIRCLKQRVSYKRQWSLRTMTHEKKISLHSVRRLVSAASLKSPQMLVRRKIFPGQKERRLARTKKLLEWRDKTSNAEKVIMQNNDKWFTVDQHANCRNTRFLTPVSDSMPLVWIMEKTKNVVKVMVFGAVASDGNVFPPVFIPSGLTLKTFSQKSLSLQPLIR